MSDKGFHVKDGLYFKRVDEGKVVVEFDGQKAEMTQEEWCSVMASVSNMKDEGFAHRMGMVLHNGG